MGITGNLKTMALSELLQWLSMGLKTGTLLVQGSGGSEKRIYFQDGRVTSSSSSVEREYLGHFLVSHGYITESELTMAMEVQEESKILLGKILVMINAISETDLLRLMRKKAEESIFDIFLWEEGEFKFLDNELPDQKMVPLSLDVTGIVMEGLRRLDEWQRIRARLPNVDVVPKIIRSVPVEKLNAQELLVLPYITGQRSIEEIAAQTHNPEFVVARLVYQGLTDGTMEIEEIDSAVEVSDGRGGVGDDIDNFLRRGTAMLSDNPETAWRLFKAAAELDPSDSRPAESLRVVEDQLRDKLSRDGISAKRIPSLKISPEELINRNFTSNEGFVLSRINGAWDVKSILKVSPIKEMEVLLIFKKLLTDGVVEFRDKK